MRKPLYNRALAVRAKARKLIFRTAKFSVERKKSGHFGCPSTASRSLSIQFSYRCAAQSLRLAFLESREKVQEACEEWGSLPQTSTEWSDLPEAEGETYED